MKTNRDNPVIDYEEIFKQDQNQNLTVKSSLINTIMVLIIYGVFSLTNIIQAFQPPADFTKNLNAALDLVNNEYLVIYEENELDNALIGDDLKDYYSYSYTYNEVNYFLITKNSNYNLSEIDIRELMSQTELAKWPDGNTIKIIYDSNQIISAFSLDNQNFINILTLYDYTALALSNALIFVLLLVIVGLLLFKDLRNDTFIFFKDKNFDGPKRLLNLILPLILVSYGSGFVSNILAALFKIKNTSDNQLLIELMFSSNAKFIMLINVVILAPIIEELVFRKGIFNIFKNKKTAMIVSSLTFTMIHLITESVNVFSGGFDLMKIIELFILIIPYASMAIFLSYTYKENEENITLLIFLHAIVNAISGIAILLA